MLATQLAKKLNILFLLIILLFLSFNILSYNHIVLGKENDNDEENDNDNIDIRKEDDRLEKDNDEEDKVPFILPLMPSHFPDVYF